MKVKPTYKYILVTVGLMLVAGTVVASLLTYWEEKDLFLKMNETRIFEEQWNSPEAIKKAEQHDSLFSVLEKKLDAIYDDADNDGGG